MTTPERLEFRQFVRAGTHKAGEEEELREATSSPPILQQISGGTAKCANATPEEEYGIRFRRRGDCARRGDSFRVRGESIDGRFEVEAIPVELNE